MAEKGWLSKEQEKKLADIIDDAVKAKGLIELIDGFLAKITITLIDDEVIDRINVPDDIKLKIGELVDAAIDEDVDEAQEVAADIINDLVDIPAVDEDSEAVIFEGAIKIIVGAVIKWIQGKEEE